jgi:hypothetical protein
MRIDEFWWVDFPPERFFDLPVYNWVAAFRNSFAQERLKPISENSFIPLTNTVFYFQGRPLGTGIEGFKAMLRDIEERGAAEVAIFGGVSPAVETPYAGPIFPYSSYELESMFDVAMEKSKTRVHEFSHLYTFAKVTHERYRRKVRPPVVLR